MMDAAQVAVYPHVTQEGAGKLWAHWDRIANPPLPLDGSGGARFFWNGASIGAGDLKQRLAGTLGSGLTA